MGWTALSCALIATFLTMLADPVISSPQDYIPPDPEPAAVFNSGKAIKREALQQLRDYVKHEDSLIHDLRKESFSTLRELVKEGDSNVQDRLLLGLAQSKGRDDQLKEELDNDVAWLKDQFTKGQRRLNEGLAEEETRRKEEFTEQKENLDNLRSSVKQWTESSSAVIDDLKKQMTDFQVELKSTKQQLQTTQTELETSQGILQVELNSTKEQLQTTQTELETSQRNLQSMQETVRYNQGSIQSIQAALSASQEKVSSIEEELQKTQTELETSQRNLQSMQETVRSNQGSIQSSQAALSASQEKVSSIEEELQKTQTELETSQRNLESMQETVRSNQGSIQSSQSSQGALSASQEKVSSIEEELQKTREQLRHQEEAFTAVQTQLQYEVRSLKVEVDNLKSCYALLNSSELVNCPLSRGYAVHASHCIKLYTTPENYQTASDTCQNDGGHLYHYKSRECDMPPIMELYPNSDIPWLWVGADKLSTPDFTWSDGTPLYDNATVWADNEPNNEHDAGEECVNIWPGYTLNDLRCARKKAFVCQIDL